MTAGTHLVVTDRDGSSAVFMNVRNPAGLRSCVAKLGRQVRPATDGDLEHSGITAAMDEQRRELGAPTGFARFLVAKHRRAS